MGLLLEGLAAVEVLSQGLYSGLDYSIFPLLAEVFFRGF